MAPPLPGSAPDSRPRAAHTGGVGSPPHQGRPRATAVPEAGPVALLAALLLSPPLGAQAPILDMHLHALPVVSQGPPPLALCIPPGPAPAWDPARPFGESMMVGMKEPPCPDPVWSPATDAALMEATLEVLRRRNIIGVLSGPMPRVAAWREAAPDRIIPAILVNPARDADVTPDLLRRLVETGAVRVPGEIGAQYSGIAPDDPRMALYWSLAEELDVPVAVHVGPGPPGAPYLGFEEYRARLHSPLAMEEVLVRHPRLRVYLMHAGYPMLDDLLALLYAHPQVHVDVGVIAFSQPRTAFHRFLRGIVEAGFGARVMFGSDQMVWPGAIEVALGAIEEAPYLDEAARRDILYHNAARFLRLDAAEMARHHALGGMPPP